MNLDSEQQEAVDLATTKPLTIITGGPGMGKTACIRSICDALDMQSKSYRLCAPTGKAAKRMQELTGRPASTIHRMLGATYGSWKYNKSRPLIGYSQIIVDESSMLDTDLCFHLLQAIPRNTRMCFVGDVDQLPPVGPGTPFKDMIACGRIPVARLLTNHRTGKGSAIASNARVINNGGRFSISTMTSK
jgi:exodeoxyribonuclease V alpha subunit